MISESTLRRALNRIATLKYFPIGNKEAMIAVGEMFTELYSTDAEVDRAVSNLLHDSEMSEWPGPGAFFDALQRAIYPQGMIKRDDKWVPHPRNGQQFDIVDSEGRRYWINGVCRVYPEKPWDEKASPEDGKEL